jgi:sporulation protein YlmC with PRC-barrel domain
MDIPIDVEVFCADGLCGRSTHVVLRPNTEEVTHLVLRPNTEEVTHLVVKEKEPPHQEILIPVTAVTATTPDSVNVRYTRDEIAELQPFIETEYVQVEIPRYAGGAYFVEPYVYPEVATLAVKHEAIPADELAVRRGAWVEATDGRVGHVDEFLVDPENDYITHLVLREGHLWGQKEVAIPVSEIQQLTENTVHLKLDKRGVGALPAIPMRRKWL